MESTPPSREPPAWRRRAGRALDALYPAECALCGDGLDLGRSLCVPCAVGLPRLREPFCQACGEAFSGLIEGPFKCPNCDGRRFSFAFARPALLRDEQTLDLIHRLKYRREIWLAGPLAGLAAEALRDPRFERALAERWPLVAVPLHRSKLRQRHFNQASEIVRHLSCETGLPQLDALRRIRATDTQTRLGRKQRMENLRGAFAATRAARRWLETGPLGAVLVDDVLTTGSTVNECAKTLRDVGFLRVKVLTVMRG